MNKKFFVALILLCFFAAACLAATCQTKAAKTKAATVKKPDLVVTKVLVTRPKTKGSNKVTLTYTIRNQGNAPSPATKARINNQTTGGQSVTQATPALRAGDFFTKSVDYNLATEGNYTFKVKADYQNIAPENSELNNENAVSFGFSRKF